MTRFDDDTEKRSVHFEVQCFKPSGKYYKKVNRFIDVTVLDDGKSFNLFMPEVVDYLHREFGYLPGWTFVTTHDLGYPVLVRIPGEPDDD